METWRIKGIPKEAKVAEVRADDQWRNHAITRELKHLVETVQFNPWREDKLILENLTMEEFSCKQIWNLVRSRCHEGNWKKGVLA